MTRTKPRSRKCPTCKGEGSVWLPLPDDLLVFYGDDIKELKEQGAELKTIFRCHACNGSGRVA